MVGGIKMKSELPEIEIEGTTFFFDIDTLGLVEKDNQANEISVNGMWDSGTGYAFNYSTVSKNCHWIRFDPARDNPIDGLTNREKKQIVNDPPIYVEIPRIGVMDPEGMRQKYGCTLEDIERKTDFEIMVDQDAFNRRINGEPVTIDLLDKRYEVDVVNNSLRPQDGIGEEICLNAFHYTYYYEDMGVYHLFYNISEHRAVDVMEDGSIDRTADRVILEVPNVYHLDPIGHRLSKGEDPRPGLLKYDMPMNHVALAVPWEFYNIKISENDKNVYRPERVLPLYNILGTDFLVDVDKLELREKGNPQNAISFSYMDDYENTYGFYYNRTSKNVAHNNQRRDLYVSVPPLVQLNPLDMAMKYGLGMSEVMAKSDFELLVDQDALDKRINKGMLPTLEIYGHTFYVDLRMDKLRSKDDFLSNGITFSEIKNCFDKEKELYFIPYNPEKHEFHKIDYETITRIPEDLIVVSFPHERVLDPVGANDRAGFVSTFDLKFTGLKMNYEATPAKWEDINVPQKIKENLDKVQKESKREKHENKVARSKKRGHSI